jgi:hypothetical protein
MNGMHVTNNNNVNRYGLQNTFYGPSCNPRMTAAPSSQSVNSHANRSPEMNMANVFKLFFQMLNASQRTLGQRPPHSILRLLRRMDKRSPLRVQHYLPQLIQTARWL